jgi:hypothetical protein
MTSVDMAGLTTAISTKKLPQKIRGKCAQECRRLKALVGDTLDIAILDPVILRDATLVSKDISTFPTDVQILIEVANAGFSDSSWWQFEVPFNPANGFVFVEYEYATRLKNV